MQVVAGSTDLAKPPVFDVALRRQTAIPHKIINVSGNYFEPFIKDQTVSISQLITTKIGKLGENITVRRFARFKVGDAGETIAISKPEQKPE